MPKGLYNDDCMNIFALLEDKTVDMICTDIPYGECKKERNSFQRYFLISQ